MRFSYYIKGEKDGRSHVARPSVKAVGEKQKRALK